MCITGECPTHVLHELNFMHHAQSSPWEPRERLNNTINALFYYLDKLSLIHMTLQVLLAVLPAIGTPCPAAASSCDTASITGAATWCCIPYSSLITWYCQHYRCCHLVMYSLQQQPWLMLLVYLGHGWLHKWSPVELLLEFLPIFLTVLSLSLSHLKQ